MAPRETENNAYAKFWGDKQRALWYVMVFSGVVNSYSIQVERLVYIFLMFFFNRSIQLTCSVQLTLLVATHHH